MEIIVRKEGEEYKLDLLEGDKGNGLEVVTLSEEESNVLYGAVRWAHNKYRLAILPLIYTTFVAIGFMGWEMWYRDALHADTLTLYLSHLLGLELVGLVVWSFVSFVRNVLTVERRYKEEHEAYAYNHKFPTIENLSDGEYILKTI